MTPKNSILLLAASLFVLSACSPVYQKPAPSVNTQPVSVSEESADEKTAGNKTADRQVAVPEKTAEKITPQKDLKTTDAVSKVDAEAPKPADSAALSEQASVSAVNPQAKLEPADSVIPAPKKVIPPPKKAAPAEPNIETDLSPKKIQSLLDEALDFCQAAQDFWQKGELENAFEALDQAYSLILRIDGQEIKPELLQQKEDLRFLISKRILEIYASRNIVVNGEHNAIPLEINSHVQREIDLFTKGKEKSFFIESYKRSGLYHDAIVSALEEAGLPTELSWLPLIESGFKVNALSKARALGLWQFIPSTGYKFGLKRNVFIDERLDPEKSTKAAIAYFKELHQIFGDWTTVLAAYNCGEGRVLRVIRDQNVNYLDNFWDLYQRLPFETARYVPRFLATLHILKNAEKYGIDAITPLPPITSESVTVTKQVHLKDVATAIGSSEHVLRELNPELRYRIVPLETYSLKVPPGTAGLLLSKLETIPTSSRPRPAYVTHRVRQGETLSVIAKRYKTSVTKIARANNIHRQNFIVAGKTLKIPLGGGFTYQTTKHTGKASPRSSAHVVKSGDSLWILAKRYETTVKEIQQLNQLSSTRLHIGQVLKIPGSKPEPPPVEGIKTYQVKRGDSPFKIAKRHKMPLEQFLRINRLTPRSKIYPGQKLLVE